MSQGGEGIISLMWRAGQEYIENRERQAERERSHLAYLERQEHRAQNHQEYLERQARRDQNHQAYLERQAHREQNHREYLERQGKREARQAEYYEQSRETTLGYYQRYENIHRHMIESGDGEYIPNEMENFNLQLQKILDLLASDPVAARDASIALGGFVSSLPSLARTARLEFEKNERERRRQEQEAIVKAHSDAEKLIMQRAAAISDPVERDFAYGAIKELAGRISQIENNSTLIEQVNTAFEKIRNDAAAKAEDWKRGKVDELKGEAKQEELCIHKQVVASTGNENKAAVESLVRKLDEIYSQLGGAVPEKMVAAVVKEMDNADHEVADERCRKEVVRAMVDSLQRNGFVLVDNPKRKKGGEKDEVVIIARKTSGNQAELRIEPNGKFSYHFDQYKGMACAKDIDAVSKSLDDIYGIKISKERVIWQNPDDLLASSKPIPGSERRKA